jgi:hypothetical protein
LARRKSARNYVKDQKGPGFDPLSGKWIFFRFVHLSEFFYPGPEASHFSKELGKKGQKGQRRVKHGKAKQSWT